MDLIEGGLAERLALKQKGEVAYPTLHAEKIVIRHNRGIDHHDVHGGGLLDLSDQVPPQGKERRDGAGIKVTLGPKAADERSPRNGVGDQDAAK